MPTSTSFVEMRRVKRQHCKTEGVGGGGKYNSREWLWYSIRFKMTGFTKLMIMFCHE